MRLRWIFLLVAVYVFTLYSCASRQDVTSALHVESLDEFFPDAGKASERVKESEVGPGPNEMMNSDDVAQTLTWYTTWCREKAGADDHIKDVWQCQLLYTAFRNPHGPQWDIHTNRGLEDEPADDFKDLRLRGVFDDPSTPEERAKSNKSVIDGEKICSKSFLRLHMVEGHDPFGHLSNRYAHYGNADEFSKTVLEPQGIESISADYDEDTFTPDRNPMFEDFASQVDADLELTERLEHIRTEAVSTHQKVEHMLNEKESRDKNTGSILLEMRSSGQMIHRNGAQMPAAQQLRGSKKQMGPKRRNTFVSFLQRRSKGHHAARTVHKLRPRSKLQGKDSEETDIAGTYAPGCFSRFDIMGQIRAQWLIRDIDGNYRVNATQADDLLRNTFDPKRSVAELRNSISDLKPKDGLKIDEYVKIVQRNIDDLRLQRRGFLTNVCRNHHWGLLNMCKPDDIRVAFRIQQSTPLPGGGRHVTAYMDVILTFNNIGTAPGSGFYNSKIKVHTKNVPGDHGVEVLIGMNIVIALMALLFLLDFFYTLALWPVNLWRLAKFRLDRLEALLDPQKAADDVYRRFVLLLDARAVRIKFTGFFFVFLDWVIAVIFLRAVYQCVKEAYDPEFLPGMVSQSKECTNAYINAEADRIYNLMHGLEDNWKKQEITGISTVEFINKCLGEISPMQKITELEYALLFKNDGWHALVVSLVLFRLFQILDLYDSLRWLPLTMSISSVKLINFFVAYFVFIGIFAVNIHLAFGGLYKQFNTLLGSCYALVLFSFGDTLRAMQDIRPFVEDSSTKVLFALWLYTIVVVIMGLGVFTTIILTAYVTASDPEQADKSNDDAFYNGMVSVVAFFGGGPEPDSDSDHDIDEPLEDIPEEPAESDSKMLPEQPGQSSAQVGSSPSNDAPMQHLGATDATVRSCARECFSICADFEDSGPATTNFCDEIVLFDAVEEKKATARVGEHPHQIEAMDQDLLNLVGSMRWLQSQAADKESAAGAAAYVLGNWWRRAATSI